MTAETRKEFLARTPFFGGLPGSTLERLVALLREVPVARGAEVFHEGDTGCSMYVVERGEMVARQSAGPARTIKLMRFLPGDFFGETTLIEMQPRPFSAVAESDGLLLELGARELYRLYQEDVKGYVLALQNINRELCRRLRKAGDRVAALASERTDDTEITQIGGIRLPPL